MKKINKKNGFTLFEILITISIIAVLTVLISIAYSVAQKKTRDTRRMEDMKLIQSAAEQYFSLNNSYPNVDAYKVGVAWTAVDGTVILENYPSDPKDKTAYKSDNISSRSYCVCARLEDTTSGNSTYANCRLLHPQYRDYFCVKNQQ